MLGWQHTHKDPDDGRVGADASWLLANLNGSLGDIFRELLWLSPGGYQPLQIRTLLRDKRKIPAYLLETQDEQ